MIDVNAIVQSLDSLAYCKYDGDCIKDECEICSDYVINYGRAIDSLKQE